MKFWAQSLSGKGIIIRNTSKPETGLFILYSSDKFFTSLTCWERKKNNNERWDAREWSKQAHWLVDFFIETVIGPGLDRLKMNFYEVLLLWSFTLVGCWQNLDLLLRMGEAEEVIERKGRRNNEVHLKEQVKLTEIYLILAYKSLANRRWHELLLYSWLQTVRL